MPPNTKFKLKQVILYAPNQFQLFPIQLSHFDPSKLTKLIVEHFFEQFGPFLADFRVPRTNSWVTQINLEVGKIIMDASNQLKLFSIQFKPS